MSDNTETTTQAYKLFIEKTAASKLVWGLYHKQGWANSHSADNEELDVVPFWSDRALAKICAKDDWRSYTPTQIPLAEFLESWCMEMAENEILLGVNWDAQMIGSENNALTVALDILNRLNEMQSAITINDAKAN